ncbi:1314_t:CDS:2, partial [Dentiscutata heterogama]
KNYEENRMCSEKITGRIKKVQNQENRKSPQRPTERIKKTLLIIWENQRVYKEPPGPLHDNRKSPPPGELKESTIKRIKSLRITGELF